MVIRHFTKTFFSASFTDECRIIEFKEPIENKAMKDRLIRSAEVINEGSCRAMCYMEPNCVSINFGPSHGGKYRCELNNATDDDHLIVLEKKPTFTFLAIEVNIFMAQLVLTVQLRHLDKITWNRNSQKHDFSSSMCVFILVTFHNFLHVFSPRAAVFLGLRNSHATVSSKMSLAGNSVVSPSLFQSVSLSLERIKKASASFWSITHLRVDLSLSIKARSGAQPSHVNKVSFS